VRCFCCTIAHTILSYIVMTGCHVVGLCFFTAAAAAGYALYGFLTMAMDGTAALLLALLDLHIVPAFDKPWRSLSLAEFWGR
jgi:hypothetical protein